MHFQHQLKANAKGGDQHQSRAVPEKHCSILLLLLANNTRNIRVLQGECRHKRLIVPGTMDHERI
jgi:hypothetical protein